MENGYDFQKDVREWNKKHKSGIISTHEIGMPSWLKNNVTMAVGKPNVVLDQPEQPKYAKKTKKQHKKVNKTKPKSKKKKGKKK